MWEFINALAEPAEIWFSIWAGAAWRPFDLASAYYYNTSEQALTRLINEVMGGK